MSTESALTIKLKLNNGIEAPAIALGTYNSEGLQPKVKDAVKAAVKGGYRHIDTAWIYGTETYIGEALAELFAEGVVKREDLFITTKVWPTHWNDPSKSIDESLKRLGIDYLDLVLQHWPLTFKVDADGNPLMNDGQFVPDDGDYLDTWKKLIALYKKDNKKIRSIGVSNYTIPYLERLLKETDIVPVVNQVELHPSLPQVDLVKFSKDHGILTEAFSPLGSRGAPLLKLPIVETLAKKYDASPAEILINYHVKSGRLAAPRSINTERLAKGFNSVPLTADDLKSLDQEGIDHPKRYVNMGFAKSVGYENWSEDKP
ncbi:unnamed protein product [Ambrosiozyma monospora]|uniref:2-dehydropantolactone reductase n=1 Tax=Ambrosiozyma monospora TaxID=43982 RepID=A0A9W6YU36_AMBMO|nr:unnamed protein product [Ambrosiozyma monospora]